MKSIKLLMIALFVSILLCIATGVPESGAESLEVGVFDFPPFYNVIRTDQVEGLYVDFIHKVMEHAGVEATYRGYPPKRLYANLAKGITNIYLGIRGGPSYDPYVLYSKNKILDIDLRVYIRKETPLPSGLSGLNNQRILTIRGYGYGGMVEYLEDPKNGITLDPANTHEAAFLKLKNKRANYLLDYRKPAQMTLETVQMPPLQSVSIKIMDVYFMVSKKTPNPEQLIEKIEKAAMELKERGQI